MAKAKKPAKPTPLIDLRKGLFLEVDGEEEKNHTLNWDILKAIGDKTQDLIYKLAKHNPDIENIPSEFLKLNFVGFFAASAVPEFRLPESHILFDTKNSYNILNADFASVIENVQKGNFQKIADKYKTPSGKNEIIAAVYDFTNSAGTRPFKIVKRHGDGFTKLAMIRRMDLKHKQSLYIPEAKGSKSQVADVEAVGKVLVKTSAKGRQTKKTMQLYTQKEVVLSVKFDSIETDSKIYVLKNDVLFNITEDSKKSCVIENQTLDIYAFGISMSEAEKDLFSQFDYTYQRLNTIPDEKLSSHLLTAKKYINLIVESVKVK